MSKQQQRMSKCGKENVKTGYTHSVCTLANREEELNKNKIHPPDINGTSWQGHS